jgi:hypothetical protein
MREKQRAERRNGAGREGIVKKGPRVRDICIRESS